MITYEYKFGYYTVYLNGKFLETCESFRELKETCAKYGVSI